MLTRGRISVRVPHRGECPGSQDGHMADPDLSVRVRMRSSAARVWASVADPARIVDWSPESTGVRTATPGPLPVGATFAGANRNGLFRWSTQCTVVESVPDRAFAFDVTFLGMAVARWRYSIAEEGDGVLVEEEWWDRRGRLMVVLGALGTGVVDRRAHNQAGMRATLEALRRGMESRSGA